MWLMMQLGCSEDGACPCSCDYAVDQGCACRDLVGPVLFTMDKSTVHALYPLTFIKNTPLDPYEETVFVDANTCVDGDDAEIPSCNWLSLDNEIQEHSQVISKCHYPFKVPLLQPSSMKGLDSELREKLPCTANVQFGEPNV